MSTVQDVYQSICDVLLEPSGLTSGIYTEAQFLDDFREVLWDLLQQTCLVKALLALAVTSGTSEMSIPDCALSVEDAVYDARYLHYATALEMDNLIAGWRSTTGLPKRYHEDRLPPDTLGLVPTPNVTGGSIAWASPLYGTLSSTAGATDFDFEYSAALSGTIAGFTGPVFIETIVPLYGTISELVPSNKNLTLLAPVKPLLQSYTLTDRIEILPDSFLPYLKYGILALVFGRDGETRDPLRQNYCASRYQEGINLGQAISLESLEAEQEEAIA